MTLGIHFFGTGFGESILLELPSNNSSDSLWGIIDCLETTYKGVKYIPPLEYLRKKNVSRLEFACLTHPHLDHYKGYPKFLSRIQVERWWESAILTNVNIASHMLALETCLSQKDYKVSREEYEELVPKIIEFKKSNKYQAISGIINNLYYTENPKVMISSVAPNGEAFYILTKDVARAINKLIKSKADGGDYELTREQINDLKNSDDHYNTASVVLILEYGDTRVVLGGDADISAWRQIYLKEGRSSLACMVLKVSHHGSKEAFHVESWDEHAKPIAIITPFRCVLPKQDMLRTISKYSSITHITSNKLNREKDKSMSDAYNSFPIHEQNIWGISVYLDNKGRIISKKIITPDFCLKTTLIVK